MSPSELTWGEGLLPTLALAALAGSAALALALLGACSLLRHRAGARHALVLSALLAYAAAPLAVVGARLLPAEARRLTDPVTRALARADLPLGGAAPANTPAAAGAATPAPAAGPRWLLALWALGTAGLLLRLGIGLAQVRRLRRGALPLAGETAAWAGALLRARFPGRRLPALLASPAGGSPLVLGLRRPAMLLPPAVLGLPRADLAQVLVHEMGHVVRGDLLAGALVRVVLALHWPNPLLHLAARALARACEESCDDLVLAGARPAHYARTLLAVATAAPAASSAPALALGAGRGELERRVRRMLARPDVAVVAGAAAARRRWPALWAGIAGAALVALAGAAAGLAGTASAVARPAPAAAADESDALELFMDAGANVTGAFVLRELGAGLKVVNRPLASTRFTPASTFKIVVAAAGLETGTLPDERTVWRWTGEPQPYSSWRRDMDLADAMRLSANWFFERLYQTTGPARVQAMARKLRFAPGRPSTTPTWIDGGFVTSALDQVAFLQRFAAGQLPLAARTQDILRKVLVIEERNGVILRGKTGLADLPDGGGTLGWLVGTVDMPGKRFAYATVFRGARTDADGIRERRLGITRRLLARYGALPAEMAP
jgi:beta-lactamase class D/beta-lactamase regulating signal transducer with metallopeptidase domain